MTEPFIRLRDVLRFFATLVAMVACVAAAVLG